MMHALSSGFSKEQLITSFERIGLEKGLEQGLHEGIVLTLTLKFEEPGKQVGEGPRGNYASYLLTEFKDYLAVVMPCVAAHCPIS